MLKLWNFIRGYVVVRVTGCNIERFLNLAGFNNIYIWDIKTTGTYMTMKMSVKGVKKIKPYAKKSSCKFKIISKHGYPFFIFKYRKRYLFTMGSFIFLFILYFLSSFIWLIDIKGNSKLTDTQILSLLNENKIYVGAYKKNIDTANAQKQIKLKAPDISWINITIKGTRAEINLAEGVKAINIVDNSAPCDIISDKSCIITNIITRNGTPMVKKMDVVEKGDILVSGVVPIPQEDGGFISSYVGSQATIKGKLSHSYSFKIPYSFKIKKYTGNKKNSFSLEVFNKNFNFNFIKNNILYEKYDTIKRTKQLGFNPDFPLPFKLNLYCYKEYTEQTGKRTIQQAKDLAEILVTNKIINELPTATEVLDKQITFKEYKDCLEVYVKLTTEEAVGINSKISIKEPENINGTKENSN